MRILGVSLLTATFIVGIGAVANAKPKAKAKAAGVSDHPPSAEEIGKLKGKFTWGLSPQDVVGLVKEGIEEKFKERQEKAKMDSTKQDRLRKEKLDQLNAVKKSFVKFDGQKSGWDVSIVDQEFAQNSGESMLATREDIWTRYFFFFEDRLYKMYLAFEKQALGGKDFKAFSGDMQAKFGKAREVFREEKMKGGAKKVLDHYAWVSMTADSLKFVDRSTFYNVYCLVVFDTNTADRVAERRKLTNPASDTKDSLVEAVTAKGDEGRDSNDNVIDRITGREIKKPGEERGADIVVPSVGSSPGPSATRAAGKDKGKKAEGSKRADGLEL